LITQHQSNIRRPLV